MLTVTLSAVGLPLEGIAFIAAVDRIIDMMRTTTNVTGDMAVSLVVAKSENMVNEEVLAAGMRNEFASLQPTQLANLESAETRKDNNLN